jgi:hypothetical protein
MVNVLYDSQYREDRKLRIHIREEDGKQVCGNHT